MRMFAPIIVLALGSVTAASTWAQEPVPTPAPPESAKPTPVATPTPPRQSPVNVRIDLTLTDRSGSNPPVVKTATLLLADGFRGSVRFSSEVSGSASGVMRTLPLDVDARPTVEGDKRVRVELSLGYKSLDATQKEGSAYPTAELKFFGQTFLETGKSALVALSADPVSDRKVTLEAKATILK